MQNTQEWSAQYTPFKIRQLDSNIYISFSTGSKTRLNFDQLISDRSLKKCCVGRLLKFLAVTSDERRMHQIRILDTNKFRKYVILRVYRPAPHHHIRLLSCDWTPDL